MILADLNVGDKVTHENEGEGTIRRIGVGPKNDLLDVLFAEDEVNRFVGINKIIAVNGIPVIKKRKFKPTDYQVVISQHFTEAEQDYFKAAVVRVVYRPHPGNFENFKEAYSSTTGQVCPLEKTNRSEASWDDCAQIFLSIYPPSGLIEQPLKQSGDLWYFESVRVAWQLFECGYTIHEQNKPKQ